MVGQSNKISFSKKCLCWQHEEIMRSPLDGINVAPSEHDIYEWHGNFYFNEDHEHFPGMVLHFILNLPHDYPNSTPDMKLLTSIPHSHVFGDTICFSLLSEFKWWFEGKNLPATTFWNPSRTVRSLLESVYTFLIVDEDKHVSVCKQSAQNAIHNAQAARCSCGHHPSNNKMWPPEKNWMAAKNTSDIEQQICALAMHDDLVSNNPISKANIKRSVPTSPPKKAVIVDIPNISTSASPTSVPFNAVDFNKHATDLKEKARNTLANESPTTNLMTVFDDETRGDFRCSVTGVSFDHSESVVLGFGINVQRRKTDKTILSITSDLMPITLEVFLKGNIRKSALGMKITHFFPFAINEQHWSKAKKVLPGCIDAILEGHQEHNLSASQDDRLLFIVGELWKSMAVLMMKGGTHASEKVLKGFCALHHILLLTIGETDPLSGVAANHIQMGGKNDGAADNSKTDHSDKTQHPKFSAHQEDGWTVIVPRKKGHNNKSHAKCSFLTLANEKVRTFVRHPQKRHKSHCPDFGRFLPLLLLSDLPWREIQEPFVRELLARNARWIVRESPELRRVKPHEYDHSSMRANKSWGPSATGLKITAFQIWFVLNVHSWALHALPKNVVDAYQKLGNNRLLLRAMYDALGGRPTKVMMLKFQQVTKSIEAMASYEEFFSAIQMPVSGSLSIQMLLCDAMIQSYKCRYHR